MNLTDLLEAAVNDTILIDNVSFVKGQEVVIVDFAIKGLNSSFSLPVESKTFLSKLTKDISTKPKITYRDPNGDSRFHITEKDLTPSKSQVVESPTPPKNCKKHPQYRGDRRPRSSDKNPNGCPVCWEIYRALGKR